MTFEQEPTLEQLIAEAERENWELIGPWITEAVSTKHIAWAKSKNKEEGLLHMSAGVRDLAANFLDESDALLTEEEQEWFVEHMMHDPYHIVRYRLAIALYKRGNRSAEVVDMMQEATNDPEVGELAKSYLV